jgi:hypothetical protein
VRRSRLALPAACLAALTGVVAPPNAGAARAATTSNFLRVSGADRVATAIASSKNQYFASQSAHAVVLTRADDFPDALAGTPLAAKVGGPLLLTSRGGLDAVVRAEIIRAAPAGSTVYIIGGPNAMSSDVDDAVAALGDLPKRVYGADRYATAVAIAHELGDPSTVFEATGLNFPDALAAGPAAVKAGGAILLTAGARQAPATADYLAAHPSGPRFALGGPAAAADPSAQAFIGTDRYDTAAQVADQFFPAATAVGLATGQAFPDALAAGYNLGAKQAPLLLVPSAGALPAPVVTEILFDFATVRDAIVFGGPAAVSDGVAAQAGALAAAPAVAAAAMSSSTGRYGVRVERYATGATVVDRTVVVDGANGNVSIHVNGATSSTAGAATPTRTQLQSLPLTVAALPSAVNSLYRPFDAALGVESSTADTLFFLNAQQLLLDPVAPPNLRLVTYAALAGLTAADVVGLQQDSAGRVGVGVSIELPDGGRASVVFDPATVLPLESTTVAKDGGLRARQTVTSITTTNTAPTNP